VTYKQLHIHTFIDIFVVIQIQLEKSWYMIHQSISILYPHFNSLYFSNNTYK